MLALVLIASTVSACGHTGMGLFGETIDPNRMDERATLAGAKPLQGEIPPDGIPLVPGGTFVDYYRSSQAKPTDAAAASAFIQAGITLSDRLCAAWFQQLGLAQARADTFSSDLASLGALTTTLMGFGRVNSRTIGAISAVFLFGHQVISADQANFIVAPDIGAVESAIVSKRLNVATQMVNDAQAGRFNFWSAERSLINYDNQCSHLAIKNYITESVRTADPSKKPTNSGSNAATATDTAADASTLAAAGHILAGMFQVGHPDLTPTEVASVYALSFDTLDTQTANNLLAPLSKRGLFTSDGKPILKPKSGFTVDTLKAQLNVLNNNGALSRAAAKLEKPT